MIQYQKPKQKLHCRNSQTQIADIKTANFEFAASINAGGIDGRDLESTQQNNPDFPIQLKLDGKPGYLYDGSVKFFGATLTEDGQFRFIESRGKPIGEGDKKVDTTVSLGLSQDEFTKTIFRAGKSRKDKIVGLSKEALEIAWKMYEKSWRRNKTRNATNIATRTTRKSKYI